LKEQADNFIYDAGRESCRTIAFAYKIARTLEEITTSPDQGNGVLEFESSGLTLIGIGAVKDIIRPEIPWVVNRLHQDGIRVVMVTGDNIMTAVNISKDCGIVDKQFDTDVTPWSGNSRCR
jgi:P-type E1-E2 ATPase